MKLQDIMTRHSELQKIEKAIIEVRDLFIRISTLVMEQSDNINRIEDFATKTTTRVEKGGGALDKARKLKIKVLKVSGWIDGTLKRGIIIVLFFAEKDLALDMDYRDFIDNHLNNGHILVGPL